MFGTRTLEGYQRPLPVLFLLLFVVLVVLVVLVLRLVAVLSAVAANAPLCTRQPVLNAPPTSSFDRDVGVAVGQRAGVDQTLPLCRKNTAEP